ncbi:ribosomal oxygenase 1 isoform X2 [Protopterus annectens]|uniref:ribosomal oxygenase 1 isoform X2 n=1 Tax=Protopterus annectens TaxID=7888 RepID=UPI001CFB0439|nr:ribosomal oxygenase 1 isoform X2 [Protopterus annectens]
MGQTWNTCELFNNNFNHDAHKMMSKSSENISSKKTNAGLQMVSGIQKLKKKQKNMKSKKNGAKQRCPVVKEAFEDTCHNSQVTKEPQSKAGDGSDVGSVHCELVLKKTKKVVLKLKRQKQEITPGISRTKVVNGNCKPKVVVQTPKKFPEDLECWGQCSLKTLLQDIGKLQNSKDRAAKMFEWMIAPVSPTQFFSELWEKKSALVRRCKPDYYKGLFSTAEFDRILRENDVQFGVNLDVTSYSGGKRETHNPPGRALPLVVWDYYKNGCSLRLLNPQSFSLNVWNVLSILQEHFCSMAGTNVYLTPPGTQGFAPHYDDIEAFVLQLEGKKHWRVYKARSNDEVLPQFSSRNFSQDELGEIVLDTVLEAGDLLYFPRGVIHQGDCLPDQHSLHITLSTYQRNSWADLLEKLLPATLQSAIEEDLEFRTGLPLDYLEYMGVQNSESNDRRRASFIEKVHSLIKKLTNYAPVDAAVDQKAVNFLHDCLPPVLTQEEKALSVHGAPARWENGDARDVVVKTEGRTRIRLLRKHIARLCSGDPSLLLYYSAENSRVYHKDEPKFLEIDSEYADGIEKLIHSYPKYITVDSLSGETLDDKVSLASALFEKGLILIKKPTTSLEGN